MKKLKMLALSLIIALSFGLSVTVSNAQASQSAAPLITQASNQTFVTRTVKRTVAKSMWVTEPKNGKIYSGYIYNRGLDNTGQRSIFNGYIFTGPHQPVADKLKD